MEARGAAEAPRPLSAGRLPVWLLGLIPLLLIALGVVALTALGGPGLGERTAPPVEELVVERTVLRPGQIELTVRNDGPDPVEVGQVAVNDAYVDFRLDGREIARLGTAALTVPYDWVDGEAYDLFVLTSTGVTIEHRIDPAVATPENDAGFFGLMALLGLYVGVIPVTIGMLWLPFVRRIPAAGLRFLMALTVGLLGFLAIDAVLEGLEVGSGSAQSLGGSALVFIGAALSYLALTAVSAHMADRSERARSAGADGAHLALLVAIGIGLHNMGEGLAIGSAYAVGALALGAFLVIGFAVHNTTEGLAIVAPTASRPPSLGRLVALGAIAGVPTIVGAFIGAAAFNASLAALLLGAGAGAIIQVIQQLVPSFRDGSGRALYPASVSGIAAGIAILYVTGLLVSV